LDDGGSSQVFWSCEATEGGSVTHLGKKSKERPTFQASKGKEGAVQLMSYYGDRMRRTYVGGERIDIAKKIEGKRPVATQWKTVAKLPS